MWSNVESGGGGLYVDLQSAARRAGSGDVTADQTAIATCQCSSASISVDVAKEDGDSLVARDKARVLCRPWQEAHSMAKERERSFHRRPLDRKVEGRGRGCVRWRVQDREERGHRACQVRAIVAAKSGEEHGAKGRSEGSMETRRRCGSRRRRTEGGGRRIGGRWVGSREEDERRARSR